MHRAGGSKSCNSNVYPKPQNVHATFIIFSKKIIREVGNNKRGKVKEGMGTKAAGRQIPNRKRVQYFGICKMEYYAMIRN